MSKMSCEDNVLGMFIRDIGEYAVLSPEQESELLQKAVCGDKNAKNKLVCHNMRFVVREAKKFTGRGLELEDLIVEGSIGLGEAVDHFSVSHGVRFITYAVYRVDQAMRKAIRNQSGSIRLPEDRYAELSRIYEALDYVDGNICSLEVQKKVCALAGVSLSDLRMLLEISDESHSLNDVVSAGDSFVELSERVSDSRIVSPEESFLQKSIHGDIDSAISKLSPREAAIIRMKFGFTGQKPLSLQKIGRAVGLSKERVRQLKDGALAKLGAGFLRSYSSDFSAA